MATFAENITVIADKLTEINTSLQTIAGAIAEGGAITVDPDLVQAIKDLQFNGQTFEVGDLLKIIQHGRTLSIESF